MLTWLRKVTAHGDVTGRDKITNNILPSPSQIDHLSESFKREVAEKSLTHDLIDELLHYSNARSDIRDLSTKLSEAGYSYLVDEAEQLKEAVAKLIVKHQHYKSAQKIITYLLAEVESIFNSKIKPLLTPNIPDDKIRAILREHLESEIKDKLGENVLEVYNRQINGMMYFLTGNCHLEWS